MTRVEWLARVDYDVRLLQELDSLRGAVLRDMEVLRSTHPQYTHPALRAAQEEAARLARIGPTETKETEVTHASES